MYEITITPNKVEIVFNKLSNIVDILNLIHFYKKDKDCAVAKAVLKRRIKDVTWHNDITQHLSGPTCLLFLKLKDKVPKSSVESTHILESNVVDSEVTLELHTFNRYNKEPVLSDRDDFIRELFEE